MSARLSTGEWEGGARNEEVDAAVSRTRVRDEEGLEGRYKPLSSLLLWEIIITGDGLPVLNTW